MATPSEVSVPPLGWLVATFVVYVVLGVITKSLVLNWIIGPLWLLLTLFVLPAGFRLVRERLAR